VVRLLTICSVVEQNADPCALIFTNEALSLLTSLTIPLPRLPQRLAAD